MTAQTIHHPPQGEDILSHERTTECACKPERTTEYKNRQSKQGKNVIVHVWHKSLKGAEVK